MSQETDGLGIGSEAPEPTGDAGLVRFGVFELDRATGELRKGGALVKLRQQPFKVLAALLDRPGQVVSREDLRARVWGGETFVDFDQGVNSCIKEIRAVLGDSSETPLYVETLPRRGYRFIAPIESAGRQLDTAPSAERPRARAWGARAHLALTLLAVAAVGVLLMRRPPDPADWQRLTYRRGALSAARFSSNGDIVLSAAWDGGAPALYASTPGSPDARALPFEGTRVVGMTARGELAYLALRPGARSVLVRAPLAGGAPKEILENVLEADVTADGAAFAISHLVAGRGAVLEYPIGHALSPVNAPTHLRISPDGRHLAVLEHVRDDDDRGWVLILDREGRRVAWSSVFASVEGLAWEPGGVEVLFTASRDGSDAALRALGLGGRERTIHPARGRLVLHDVDGRGRALLERSLVRGEVTLVGESGERDLSWFDGGRAVALSADGSRLLMSEGGEASGPRQAVYLRATDGTPPVRLGEGRASDLSLDGRWAVTVPLPYPSHLELLPIGPGEPRVIRHPGIVQYEWARFLPDGRGLVFAGRERDRNLRVWVGDLGATPPRPVTREGLAGRHNLVWPEGRIVIAGCPPLRLCAYPLDGGEPRRLEGIEDRIAVGLDGTGQGLLLRARGARFPLAVERLDLLTGVRAPWREIGPRDLVGAGGLSDLVVSRDGRSYAFSFVRRLSELYLVDDVLSP